MKSPYCIVRFCLSVSLLFAGASFGDIIYGVATIDDPAVTCVFDDLAPIDGQTFNSGIFQFTLPAGQSIQVDVDDGTLPYLCVTTFLSVTNTSSKIIDLDYGFRFLDESFNEVGPFLYDFIYPLDAGQCTVNPATMSNVFKEGFSFHALEVYINGIGCTEDHLLVSTRDDCYRVEIKASAGKMTIVSSVPEPGIFSLFSIGLLGLVFFKKRRG